MSGWQPGNSVYVGSIAFGAMGQSLIVLDANRRLFAGLSRDGASVHVVHPSSVDLVDGNGAVIRREGELTCTCKGARYRGVCYRTAQAEAFQTVHGQSVPALDGPDGAGEAVEAYRG